MLCHKASKQNELKMMDRLRPCCLPKIRAHDENKISLLYFLIPRRGAICNTACGRGHFFYHAFIIEEPFFQVEERSIILNQIPGTIVRATTEIEMLSLHAWGQLLGPDRRWRRERRCGRAIFLSIRSDSLPFKHNTSIWRVLVALKNTHGWIYLYTYI